MPPPPGPVDELVIHVGTDKTGTTSIQGFLRKNRAALAERGCLVPRSPGTTRHIRVGMFIMPDEDLVASQDWFRGEYGDLPVDEALSRIETIYKPYHACLRRLLSRTHANFGMAVLIDCHSMPGNIRVAGSNLRPDVIIGDRYGTSASQEVSRAALHFLEELGFVAVCNKPYAGGFITEHYGRPIRSLHALQIEVNRALYVDEKTLLKKADFPAIQASLEIFMRQLGAFVSEYAIETSLAAE